MTEHYFSERPTSTIHLGLIKTMFRGIEYSFYTSSGVFSAKRVDLGTRILIETMGIPDKGNFLDLGCGYGPIGIVAAKANPSLKVWMTDNNIRAIKLAKENLKLNHVSNANILHGWLYKPLENLSFNLIVCNPPISAGLKRVVAPIINGALDHLEEGGCLQMVARWNKGGKTIAKMMEENFGGYEVLDKKSGYWILSAKT